MTKIPEINTYRFDGSKFIPKSSKLVKFFLGAIFVFSVGIYQYGFNEPIEEAVAYIEDSTEFKIHPAVEYITKSNSKVSQDDAIKIVDSSIKWGNKFGVDQSLLLAIAKVESTYDKFAISPVGAFGILQVLPKWHIDKIKAAKVEVGTPEMFDIDANIYVGTQIIKNCKVKYKGDINLALRCFNGSVGQKTSYDTDVIQAQRNIKYSVRKI